MKKLLGIVVLSFLLNMNAYAEYFEYYKCTVVEIAEYGEITKYTNEFEENNYTTLGEGSEMFSGKVKKRNDLVWKHLSKFYSKGQKIKRKDDVLYTIDSDNGLILKTIIWSDEYIKYIDRFRIGRFRAEVAMGEKDPYHPNPFNKLSTEKFKMLSLTGGFLIAEHLDTKDLGIEEKLNINLKTLTIRTETNKSPLGKSTSIEQCKHTNEKENDVAGSSGTAFFINNRGHLLTNNHVVEGCTISKVSYKNKDYDTKLIATDKTLDLALLKAELKPKTFINFSNNEAKKLNTIYVAGYPLGKGLSDDLKISSGIVSSLKGFEDNSNEIQIDAPINPGNSGGPIINENGDLIAIAVSGLAKDQTEGINFGIKSSAAESFLLSNNINPKKSMYSGIKDNDQLLEILEEGTVYTYCNN